MGGAEAAVCEEESGASRAQQPGRRGGGEPERQPLLAGSSRSCRRDGRGRGKTVCECGDLVLLSRCSSGAGRSRFRADAGGEHGGAGRGLGRWRLWVWMWVCACFWARVWGGGEGGEPGGFAAT